MNDDNGRREGGLFLFCLSLSLPSGSRLMDEKLVLALLHYDIYDATRQMSF